jgi:hypothetical protein
MRCTIVVTNCSEIRTKARQKEPKMAHSSQQNTFARSGRRSPRSTSIKFFTIAPATKLATKARTTKVWALILRAVVLKARPRKALIAVWARTQHFRVEPHLAVMIRF